MTDKNEQEQTINGGHEPRDEDDEDDEEEEVADGEDGETSIAMSHCKNLPLEFNWISILRDDETNLANCELSRPRSLFIHPPIS